MLYDHQSDPEENTNISELPEVQALIQELRGPLLAQDPWGFGGVVPVTYSTRETSYLRAGQQQIEKLFNSRGQKMTVRRVPTNSVYIGRGKKA